MGVYQKLIRSSNSNVRGKHNSKEWSKSFVRPGSKNLYAQFCSFKHLLLRQTWLLKLNDHHVSSLLNGNSANWEKKVFNPCMCWTFLKKTHLDSRGPNTLSSPKDPQPPYLFSDSFGEQTWPCSLTKEEFPIIEQEPWPSG